MIKAKRLTDNHIVMSGFYKAVSGLSLFVSIHLLFKYLGIANYGVWTLVFTLFQWVLLMDFGLASVLKTKIPELQHSGNSNLINSYIYSTYRTCVKIAGGVFILFLFVFFVFDIRNLLKIFSFSSVFIVKLFLLNIFFFCILFILNTHKSLFVGFHRGKFAEQSIALNQILFLLFLLIPNNFFNHLNDESKLYLISFINGFAGIIVNLSYTVYFFKSEKINIFKAEKSQKEYLKGIYQLGIKYMLIQLGILFLFSSDNFILSSFFGPKEIGPYDAVSKYFQFPLMILMSAMAPLWSRFAKHYLEKDHVWLKRSFKRFNYFYIIVVLGILVCVFIAKPIMKIWISKDFNPSFMLLGFVAVMTALRIFTTFYGYFFNGIGNLKSYLLLLSGSVLIKLPLTYLFIKLNFGVPSVVIASCCCLLVWSFVQPIEAYKIVSDLKRET